MAAIIEVQNSKIEHLSEYAEKVMKYGKKLMECIDDLESKGSYSERYGNRYGSDRHYSERWDNEDYRRY